VPRPLSSCVILFATLALRAVVEWIVDVDLFVSDGRPVFRGFSGPLVLRLLTIMLSRVANPSQVRVFFI
jgi:hypothetical protein